LPATLLETPKKSSTYRRGYVCCFFVISASFRQNSQNAHDGTIVHHPAKTPGNPPVFSLSLREFPAPCFSASCLTWHLVNLARRGNVLDSKCLEAGLATNPLLTPLLIHGRESKKMTCSRLIGMWSKSLTNFSDTDPTHPYSYLKSLSCLQARGFRGRSLRYGS